MINERYIDRKKMPQVQAKDMGDCLNFLKSKGIANIKETVSAGKIIPMQRLNMAKVEALKASKANLDKPVLVTSKYELLDGHHRWAANRDLGNQVNVIKLSKPFDDVYDVLITYDKIFYKDMNESLNLVLRSQMGNSISVRIDGKNYEYIIDGDAADIFKKANQFYKYSKGKALNHIKKYSIEAIKEDVRHFHNSSSINHLLGTIFEEDCEKKDDKKGKKDKKNKVEFDPELNDIEPV